MMRFSVVGAHNQQLFYMFKWGNKHKIKKQRVLALVLSLWYSTLLYDMAVCLRQGY